MNNIQKSDKAAKLGIGRGYNDSGIQGYNNGGLAQKAREWFMGTDTGKKVSDRQRMLDNAGADTPKPAAQQAQKVSAPVTSTDPETQRLLDKYKHMKDGGKVKGKGGPTDDKIPAMLSNGEYVLPADTTAKLGIGKLDKVVKATHKPVKSKGARHYANGTPGGVDDERKPAYNPYANASIGGMVDAAKGIASPLIPNIPPVFNAQAQQNIDAARGIGGVPAAVGTGVREMFGSTGNLLTNALNKSGEMTRKTGSMIEGAVRPVVAPVINAAATAATGDATPTMNAVNQPATPIHAAPAAAATTTPQTQQSATPNARPATYVQPTAPVVVSRQQAADANMAGQGDLNQKMLALQANRPKDSNGFGSGDFSAGEMDAINAGIRARNAQPNRDATSNMDFAAQGMGITRKGNSYSDATNPYSATTFNNGKTGGQMIEANKVPWEQRPENRQNHLDALARVAKDKENLDAMIQDRLATEAGRAKGPRAEAEMRNVNRKLGIAGLDAESQRTSRDAQAGLYGTQNEQAQQAMQQAADLEKWNQDFFSKIGEASPEARATLMDAYMLRNKISPQKRQEGYTDIEEEMPDGSVKKTRTFGDNKGGSQQKATKQQVDAAAAAKGIKDPEEIKKLYAAYGLKG